MNETLFSSLAEARRIVEDWRRDYNGERPHTGLDGFTPSEFARSPHRSIARTHLPCKRAPIGVSVGQQLTELEAEEERISAELKLASDSTPIELHPQAAARHRGKVAQIHEALTKGDAASREAITILRDLIDHILVIPTERPAPAELRVVGNLAALLVENTPETRVAVAMVAGAYRQRYSQARMFEAMA